MKKVLIIIASIHFLLPAVSISQDNASEDRLITAGYWLSKESNKLMTVRTDLSEIRKKLIDLNGSDNLDTYHINMLIEHIFLTETICMYEGILLSTLQNMEEEKKLEQYQYHHSRLSKDILKRLYLNYKSTQSSYANIDDKAIMELADKAKEEMVRTLRLIEEVIEILRNQSKINP